MSNYFYITCPPYFVPGRQRSRSHLFGVLKLRNCTRFTLKYWRKVGIRSNFVAPGEQGEYRWPKGAVFTLSAALKDNSKIRGSRLAVNPNGVYYAVIANNEVRICTGKQIKGIPPDVDNPHQGKWIPKWSEPAAKSCKSSQYEVVWCPIHEESNESPTTAEVSVSWKQGISSREGQSQASVVPRHNVVKVSWKFSYAQVSASNNTEGYSASLSTTSVVETETLRHTEGYLSQAEIYNQTTKETKCILQTGQGVAAWQPCVKTSHGDVFLPICKLTNIGDSPPIIQYSEATITLKNN